MSWCFCCFLDQISQYNSLLSLIVGKIPLRTREEDLRERKDLAKVDSGPKT